MFCPDCGQDNPGEARFCRACGAALEVSPLAEPVGTAAAVGSVEYAGFWIRFVAWIIDAVIVWIGTTVLSALGLYVAFYGPAYNTGSATSFLVLLIGPLYFVLLTGLRGQTLGKMALGIQVVRRNGQAPGIGYAALREVIGKLVSSILLFMGFFWIGWDEKKQGWHDKIAGTQVIKVRRRSLQSTAPALLTLEDLLDIFEAQDLVGALRQLNEPSDGSRETLVERLLAIDERLEIIRPDESVLEAFDACALKRVCQSIGLGSRDKAQMVKALEGVLV